MSLSRPRVETPRQLVPLPAALVDELAHGHGGAQAVRHLALFQQSLRHRLLAEVCAVAEARYGDQDTDALARPTAHAVETLRRLDADARCHAAVADVLAHPCLRTWAVRVLEQDSAPASDLAHLAAVAGAAAIRAGADADVAVPVRHGAVHLPTLGRLVIAPHQRPHPDGAVPCADCGVPDGSRGSRGSRGSHATNDSGSPGGPGDSTPDNDSEDPGGAANSDGAERGVALVDLRIRGGSCSITAAPGWQAVRAIPLLGLAGGALAVEDTDPYRAGSGPAADVADRIPREEWDAWRRTASDAWDLLHRDHARHAAGIAAGLSTLIPLGPELASADKSAGPDAADSEVPPGRASERPAFGSVAAALPRHDDPGAAAEALALRLVTGFQSAKLAAVLDMADLHDPADPHWPEARWQDAYACVAAADFWRVRRALTAAGDGRDHAEAEFARCQTDAAQAVRTLAAHPTLTSLGRRFVDGLIETLTGWTPDPR